MDTYRCLVVVHDEIGEAFENYPNVIVEAETEMEATGKAKDEVWDPRLTAAGCTAAVYTVKLTKKVYVTLWRGVEADVYIPTDVDINVEVIHLDGDCEEHDQYIKDRLAKFKTLVDKGLLRKA